MLRVLILSLLLLAGCASQPPLDVAGTEPALTPQAAVAARAEGQRVLWGGVIVNSTNLADATRLEVLAYPLGDDQRPVRTRAPLGRFIAFRSGYLETADYAPGRKVTLSGELQGVTEGKIGEATYTYPVVEIDQLQLWPQAQPRTEPRVQFGIGISIGR